MSFRNTDKIRIIAYILLYMPFARFKYSNMTVRLWNANNCLLPLESQKRLIPNYTHRIIYCYYLLFTDFSYKYVLDSVSTKLSQMHLNVGMELPMYFWTQSQTQSCFETAWIV